MSDVPSNEVPEVPGHRLDAVIGAGAYAVVWAGADASGRRVAVKVPRAAGDDGRSVAEQQVLLAVRHEHLVSLRAVVPLEDGREALVFDRVDGVGLGAMVEARGHLREGEIVTVLTPLSEAVAAVHHAGGLHGDISPGNVSITPDGRPVLLDLGAAHLAGSLDEQVWGTTGFVAPEVLAGDSPSESSDVYALGALAWFCATGNGAPDTMLRLDRDTVASYVGPALADVVGACIDPDPDQRPASAALPRLFFEAAAAEPVEVVLGTDVASALTHRLRAQARDEAPEPEPTRRRRRVPSLPSLPSVASLRALAPRRRDAPGLRSATVEPEQAPRATGVPAVLRRPAVGLAAAGVVVVAALGWAVATHGASGAPGAPDAPDAPHSVAVAAPAGETPTLSPSAVALLSSPTAPSRHATDLLQVLGDVRAEALVRRDVAALAAVHRVGSPSWTADKQTVEALVAGGNRWEGLRLKVARATVVPSGDASGPADATSAVVRARVDWTGYTLVTDAGVRAAQAPREGDLLDFHLVRGAQGWRIEWISSVRAT